MSLESKLTLLVYLKDRASFTKRLCDYFHLIKYLCHVFFADGSLEDENEKIIASFKDANFSYTYHRYPKDLTFTDFYAKVADAASKITTPYAMTFDNDNFPIVNSQLKAVEFLETHGDYVACNGYFLPFHISPDSSKPYGKNFFIEKNHRYFLYHFNTPKLQRNEDDFIDRMINSFLYYYPLYYSVFRTDVFKNNAMYTREMNYQDIFVHEFAQNCFTLIQGKIHQLDDIFFLQQQGSSQCCAHQPPFLKRLFHQDTVQNFRRMFVKCLELQNHPVNDDILNRLYDAVIVIIEGHWLPSRMRYQLIFICKSFIYLVQKKFMESTSFFWDHINMIRLKKHLSPHFIKDVKKIITSPPRQ